MNTEKYREILNSGLMLDHYLILCKISSNREIPYTDRVRGFLNLLVKKGYIDNDHGLTEKGIDFVQDCDFAEEATSTIEITTESTTTVQTTKEELKSKLEDIYNKCKERVKFHTGRYQVRARIDSKYYSFFPNITDFMKVANKVVTLYKVRDLELMEKTLIAYIDRCASANNWLPLFNYYIFKNGTSTLVTDMENPDSSGGESFKSSQKFI